VTLLNKKKQRTNDPIVHNTRSISDGAVRAREMTGNSLTPSSKFSHSVYLCKPTCGMLLHLKYYSVEVGDIIVYAVQHLE